MVGVMLKKRLVVIMLSGLVGAGLMAQRGGGTRVAPGQECPPGTTETRPGSCQAPQSAPPSIVDVPTPRVPLLRTNSPLNPLVALLFWASPLRVSAPAPFLMILPPLATLSVWAAVSPAGFASVSVLVELSAIFPAVPEIDLTVSLKPVGRSNVPAVCETTDVSGMTPEAPTLSVPARMTVFPS